MELTRYELDNGMKVLLLPSSVAPVVACNVWVGVGSADETPEEAGLAHVHEHMLFKGTSRRGVGQIAREVEAAGGHINAFTSFDQTCYYVVLSSRFFEASLDILADAIRHSSFDADELERELEVIQEEIKRGDDNPSRVASLKLFETAFREHPYRLPVIGTSASVDSFERDDVVRFFKKHYVPENMTLVLGGDFEIERARELIEEHFGGFASAGDYAAVQRPAEPAQAVLRAAVLDEAARDTHLRIGFHVPAATHDDIAAIELLGTIMGQGEAAHLNQKIVRERELVHSIYAGSYTPREAGLFIVSADYQLDDEGQAEEGGEGAARSHEEVLEVVLAEVFGFRDVEVSGRDLRRARTMLESQAVYSKQTVEQLSMKLGQLQMVTGDPLFEERYYERLAEVDVDELREVARRYLRPENCTVVVSHPPEGPAFDEERIAEVVERAFEARRTSHEEVEVALAAPAPPEPERAPKGRGRIELDEDGFAIVELDGGPTLIVQESHNVELFSVRAVGLGGLRLERPETNGINAMLSELITRGTRRRGARELAHRIESMAASFSGISGRNTFGAAMSGLSKFFVPSMELFAECLFESTIPPEEFEQVRRLQLQEVRSRREKLGPRNFERFSRAFFGDYPYGMPIQGTPESIQGLDPERLREYLRALARPERMVVSIVGDVQVEQAAALVERLFDRELAEAAAPEPAPAPAGRGGAQLVGDELDKNQAHVIVGFDAPVIASKDRYALELLHAALSGQGGRLFFELRDRQSLAYSVYPSSVAGLDASAFMINIGTSPEKIEQAVDGILEQVRRLHADPPAGRELEEARRYLIGHHDIGLQRNSTRAMSAALDKLYGLDFKRSFHYGDFIEQVTAEDLARVIDRYLDLERVVVSVTRPPGVELGDLLSGVRGGPVE